MNTSLYLKKSGILGKMKFSKVDSMAGAEKIQHEDRTIIIKGWENVHMLQGSPLFGNYLTEIIINAEKK